MSHGEFLSVNKAHPLTLEIFRYAAKKDLESTELILALAETVAVVAATLDLHAKKDYEIAQSFDDRMSIFMDRVSQKYKEAVTDMITGIGNGK